MKYRIEGFAKEYPDGLGGYVLNLDGEELPPTHELHAGREFD